MDEWCLHAGPKLRVKKFANKIKKTLLQVFSLASFCTKTKTMSAEGSGGKTIVLCSYGHTCIVVCIIQKSVKIHIVYNVHRMDALCAQTNKEFTRRLGRQRRDVQTLDELWPIETY